MLTINLIGPTWPIQLIKQMQSRQVTNSLKNKVIKSEDKEIKAQDHAPRHMRSKS